LLFGAFDNGGDHRFHLYTVDSGGGSPRRISGEVLDEPTAWRPDGSSIAAANYHGDVELISPRGASAHTLVHLSGGLDNPLTGDFTVDFRGLRWTSDGQQLTFRARKVRPET